MNNNIDLRISKRPSKITKPKVVKDEALIPITRSKEIIIRDKADMVVNHTLDLIELLEKKIVGKYSIGQIKARKSEKTRPFIVFENNSTRILVLDWKRAIGYDMIIKMARRHRERNRDRRNLVICANHFSGPAKLMGNSKAFSFVSVYDLIDIQELKSIEI